MTFSLRSDLADSLNKAATRRHKTVDSLMEDILRSISFDEPNEETAEAFKELQSGQYAGTLNVSNYAMFMKSLEDIE